MHFPTLKVLALVAIASAAPIDEVLAKDGLTVHDIVEKAGHLEKSPALKDRQAPGLGCQHQEVFQWIAADDPNPHQNFVFKQITPSVQCTGSPGNSVAVSKGLTVGWSFSLTGAVTGNPASGGVGSWLSAGFSVSKSVTTTTTQTFGCSSDTGSQQGSVCGFQRVQVTAYTIKEQKCNIASPTCADASQRFCSDTGKTGVLFSPNADQGGSSTASGNCYYNNFHGTGPVNVFDDSHQSIGDMWGGVSSASDQENEVHTMCLQG
ncbi:uncharacterized protein RSE6_06464 [Rhynchosporium secalis]|uniref:Uncharacterized protein n=1 Tax=Rhynchosporium secalis TaxID=38038 RepID=A0A1E1MAI4_RHYSE|nr:uncharacterized protein RSE6_06464 [Rhynchosporium secalis]